MAGSKTAHTFSVGFERSVRHQPMTRMWLGIRPDELCDQHLRGEHAEMHQEVGTWKRHPHGEAVVEGHTKKGQVEPRLLDVYKANRERLRERCADCRRRMAVVT